jgi:energy-converting hydrogenase Eha subunit A
VPRSRGRIHAAVHEAALVFWTPVAAFGAWALYRTSGWGPGGVGGDVRGAVLGWIGASLVVLAVYGARHGDVADPDFEAAAPEHPVRHAARYAAVFSGYILLVLGLVLVPLALILSI